jgi:hypothetical protein
MTVPAILRTTYRATITALTPDLTNTGVFLSIQGSNTKTIEITKLEYGATVNTVVGIKRCTAITGGTPGGGVTTAKHNPSAPTPGGTAVSYTTAPTALTSATNVSHHTSDSALFGTRIWDFGKEQTEPIQLKGSANFLVFSAASVGAPVLSSVNVEWTEVIP